MTIFPVPVKHRQHIGQFLFPLLFPPPAYDYLLYTHRESFPCLADRPTERDFLSRQQAFLGDD
jgi:hypothetical protein